MGSREDDRLVFRALGDRTRFMMVHVLAKREMCACDLPKIIGRAQPTVSLQLKYLERSGIVRSRKDGKRVIYWLANERVRRLIRCNPHRRQYA
jgi:ArsR family transcriptional regulator